MNARWLIQLQERPDGFYIATVGMPGGEYEEGPFPTLEAAKAAMAIVRARLVAAGIAKKPS